jgi:hypothetical protein
MWCALSVALLALSEVPLDATVETSSGARLQLATLWKQPTVLFYEDRASTDLNLHVKEALAAAGRARGLAGAVAIVAVANVAAYDFFPARNFVLAAIRDLEKKFGITVYLDFSGSLARAPWDLPSRGSTVVLLDAAGVPRRRWGGKLPPDDVQALLQQVAALLAP